MKCREAGMSCCHNLLGSMSWDKEESMRIRSRRVEGSKNFHRWEEERSSGTAVELRNYPRMVEAIQKDKERAWMMPDK